MFFSEAGDFSEDGVSFWSVFFFTDDLESFFLDFFSGAGVISDGFFF